MAIVGLRITNRGRYADGKTFGEVGAYERIDATVEYAVDPGNELAARNLALLRKVMR